MATCSDCRKEFNVSEARDAYKSEFGSDFDYDEDFEGSVCGECAMAETQPNIDLGRAIAMVNGDEDYDDDFVTEHL